MLTQQFRALVLQLFSCACVIRGTGHSACEIREAKMNFAGAADVFKPPEYVENLPYANYPASTVTPLPYAPPPPPPPPVVLLEPQEKKTCGRHINKVVVALVAAMVICFLLAIAALALSVRLQDSSSAASSAQNVLSGVNLYSGCQEETATCRMQPNNNVPVGAWYNCYTPTRSINAVVSALASIGSTAIL